MFEHPASRDLEDDLIARAASGDEDAFAGLYDVHHDRVYRYVMYRVGCAEDAEDLTQRVFLQAWGAIGRYRRTGTPFLGLLYTIAHNVTVSFLRARKPVGSFERDLPTRDRASDPDAALVESDERRRIHGAILRLKPEQQQVIALRFVEGLDCREVGAVLGKSEGNVRVIQYRALRRLRELLGKEAD